MGCVEERPRSSLYPYLLPVEVCLCSLGERRRLSCRARVPAAPGRGPLRLSLRLRRLLVVVCVRRRLLRVQVSEAPPLLPVLEGPSLETRAEQCLLSSASRLRALQCASRDARIRGGSGCSGGAGAGRRKRRSGGEAMPSLIRAAMALLLLLLLNLLLVLLPMQLLLLVLLTLLLLQPRQWRLKAV